MFIKDIEWGKYANSKLKEKVRKNMQNAATKIQVIYKGYRCREWYKVTKKGSNVFAIYKYIDVYIQRNIAFYSQLGHLSYTTRREMKPL